MIVVEGCQGRLARPCFPQRTINRKGNAMGFPTQFKTMLTVLIPGLALAIASPIPGAQVKVSDGGVQVYVPQDKFQGDLSALEKGNWETLALDKLPQAASGNPVLVSATHAAAIDSARGLIVLYARQGERLKKRGELALDGVPAFKSARIVRAGEPAKLGVEVSAEPEAPAFTLSLAPDGLLEFKPGKAQRLVLREARLRYGIVPSFVGTDLVYCADTQPGLKRLHVPSMNMVLGLVEGNDSMLVGVWPPGKQSVSFEAAPSGSAKLLDGLSLDTAGQSFYLSTIEKPGIWQAEPLKPGYLEKDTTIGWKRPFEAKWIGRFLIASEEVNYPFYFRHEKVKMWGRYIRGWFYYPIWFDGDKTVIHFEKSFPPKGDLLIYYLEKHPRRPEASVSSAVEIMEKALGKEQAAKLLDFDGVEERLLLKHGNAVCAMTNTMQKWFDAGDEVKQRAQIERWCDDVSDFIRMIRQRVDEFSKFAVDMRAFLAARAKADPKLAEAAAELEPTLTEMEQARKSGMPSTSLETVREWTDQMKSLAAEVQPGNNKRYEKLGAQCRSVAGSQDDLARDMSVLAIRLTEEAARQGVRSPEHAKLAEEVIARTREVLRKPTWWEPRRYYLPKSDPGIP